MTRIKIVRLSITILSIAILSIVIIMLLKNNSNNTIVISIPINGVVNKTYDNDNFYLTVQFNDDIIKNYSLDFQEKRFKVNKKIYTNIDTEDEYISITIVCDYSIKIKKVLLDDISRILKDEYTQQCEIVSIVNKNNKIIS